MNLFGTQVIRVIVLITIIMFIYSISVTGEELPTPCRGQTVSVASGIYNGNGVNYYQSYSTHIALTGAPWIVIRFTSNTNLGYGSYI